MKDSVKTYGLLLLTLVVAYLSAYPAYFLAHKNVLNIGGIGFSFITSLCALTTMIILPIAVVRTYYKRNERDFGFQIPLDLNRAARLTIITLLFFLLVIAGLATLPAFKSYYLINHPLNTAFFFEVLLSLIYFISEEFLFRGFVFFSLLEKGRVRAYVITNVLFALFHFGKPGLEVFFALFLGLALSFLSEQTRSFVPAALIHFLLALALNLSIIFIN